MNILFFTENYPPETNAAASRVHERALHWLAWGHRVTVITCQPNFPIGRIFDGYRNRYEVSDVDGIRVVRVRSYVAANRGVWRRTLDFLSFMVMGYLAAAKEARPDVVVSTSPQFFAAVAAWWYARRRRLPYVFELGDLWPASIAAVGAVRFSLGLRLIEKLELRMYRDAAVVVVLTKAFRANLIERGVPAGKIAVVINGVELARYGALPRDETLAATHGLDGKFVVAYFGTHGMAHGLANVLDAAALLDDRPDIRIVFLGAGAERDALIERARAMCLDNVVFLPMQPKSRMPAYWSLADVALAHLKNDAVFAGVIPSKIFEAMGMGVPILFAGPQGEGSAIVTDAGAGICVPPDSPDALAAAIRSLHDDDALRRRLAAASAAAAPTHSRESQARRMIAALEAAVTGNGANAAAVVEAAHDKEPG